MADTAKAATLIPGDDATVFLDDVHVTYRVHGDTRPRLKDLLRGQRVSPDENVRQIKAVRGVTLTARQGEAIGLIGRNGSGKSTLLRAMAGLLPVTEGDVYATSQPTLLGVGAALQQNISGRRNILLGGLALGLTRDEIEAKMDEVIDFADLAEFIDLPLKTYSSGMRARLLFSISTAVRPEILLIDEALSVGDDIFRRRSEKRIKELLKEAGTVFIVSHSFASLEDICTRVMWLEKGELRLDGEPEDVIGAYKAFVKQVK